MSPRHTETTNREETTMKTDKHIKAKLTDNRGHGKTAIRKIVDAAGFTVIFDDDMIVVSLGGERLGHITHYCDGDKHFYVARCKDYWVRGEVQNNFADALAILQGKLPYIKPPSTRRIKCNTDDGLGGGRVILQAFLNKRAAV